MSLLSLLLAATIAAPAAVQVQARNNVSYNGLAMSPQMGWNSWNTFACNISEEIILSAAKTLISTGMKDVGYNYVLIDDCWHAPAREADGRPKSDDTKFPRGMKALVDEIHDLGLLVGIYSSAGTYTCGLQYGSLDYEEIDAKQYAAWGFDYLKYDNCYNRGRYGSPKISYDRYKVMSDALLAASNETGRPIFLSLCQWGEDGVENWGSDLANSWRMSGDIEDRFNGERDECAAVGDRFSPAGYFCSVENIVEKAVKVSQKVRRGSWADLDMLEVGRGGMTTDEYIVHFTLWAMMKSPLILGNDLTIMDDVSKAILTNKAIIHLSQISEGSGSAPRRVKGTRGEVNIYKSDVLENEYVVAVVNWTDEDLTLDVDMKDVFRDEAPALSGSHFHAEDLWASPHFPFAGNSTAFGTNAIAETVTGKIESVQVRKHAARVWKLTLREEKERRAVEAGRRARFAEDL